MSKKKLQCCVIL